jgi:subtilisin family serine protease
VLVVDGSEIDRVKNKKAKKEILSYGPNLSYKTFLTPNDNLYDQQWALPKISAPAAWDITTGSSEAVVAVIDTGFVLDHDDLNGKFTSGKDIILGTDNPYLPDGGGTRMDHGTAVAGVIAATTNNSKGIAGIDWGARIMPIRAFDNNGDSNTALIVSAVNYARSSGANVINMSFGGDGNDPNLETALNGAYGAGITLVAASGNDSRLGISYPAKYSNVIAVGSVNSNDVRASTSNYGPELDVVAPGGINSQGVSILSTSTQWSETTGYSKNFYATKSGTSLAAPYVSGLASLLLSTGNFSPSEVRNLIRSGADKVAGMGGEEITEQYGYGRINAYRSLIGAPTLQNLTLTNNLSTSPSTKVVGQELVANFVLKNNNSAPITLDRLKVDVRGGTAVLDIAGASGVTIGAGESINFSDYNNKRLINGYGSYTANIRMLYGGKWYSISGGSQSFSIGNFSASHIEVSSPLVFNPNPSSTSGETTATFQLKNKTQAPIYFERIKIDVRSSSSAQDYVGYSGEWVNLSDFSFNQAKTITVPGSYTANIRVRVNGRWYTPSGNVSRSLTVRDAVQNLTLTNNLSTSPSTKVVGQELVANFVLKNNNSAPITLDRLKVDVRGGTAVLDIAGASGVTIGAGESINFSDYNNKRLINGYGSYTANIRMLYGGKWYSISGGSQSFSIGNFSASHIEVSSPLVFNPNPSSTSGETTATFQLKNKTQAPIYFERIKIDVRSSSSAQDYVGYSGEWVNLSDFSFNQAKTITVPGSYTANIRVRVNGRWYTPSGNVLKNLIVQ